MKNALNPASWRILLHLRLGQLAPSKSAKVRLVPTFEPDATAIAKYSCAVSAHKGDGPVRVTTTHRNRQYTCEPSQAKRLLSLQREVLCCTSSILFFIAPSCAVAALAGCFGRARRFHPRMHDLRVREQACRAEYGNTSKPGCRICTRMCRKGRTGWAFVC